MMKRVNLVWACLIWCVWGSLSVFATGRISAIECEGGQVDLMIETSTNVRYQIQYTTDLTSNDWTAAAADFTATDQMTHQQVSEYGDHCWYRVVITMTPEVRASGRISRFQVDHASVSLSIETLPQVYYQLQCRTSLITGRWEDEGDEFVATGTSTQRSAQLHGTHCMYRAVATRIALGESPTGPDTEPPPPPF